MMSNVFKDVEETLNIEETPSSVKEKVVVEKKKIESSEDHNNDIRSDYEKVRQDINNNLETSQAIIDKIQDNILNPDDTSDDSYDRYLARKAEVMTMLIKTSIDLRKELMSLHKTKKELLEEKKEDKEEKKLTTSELKEMINKEKKENLW